MPVRFLLAAACLINVSMALAQEKTWTVSAVAGIALLDLGSVNDDNANDVEGYRQVGFTISSMPSLSDALVYGGKVTYRFSREHSASLTALHSQKEVTTSGTTSVQTLELKRSIKWTDVVVGISQNFPVFYGAGKAYAELQLGYTFVTAGSEAFQTETTKDSSLTIITILDDTKGTFKESRLVIAIEAGASFAVLSGVIVRAQVAYKLSKLGQLEGELTTFGQTRPHTTNPSFNLSGFLITGGIGIEL